MSDKTWPCKYTNRGCRRMFHTILGVSRHERKCSFKKFPS